jgi:hypothetical protein
LNTPSERGARIRFFAPVDPDGCQFCCEFRCQLTPTPTPEFDPQGRRVYTRNEGRFLLILEGAAGSSNRPPGVFLETGPGQRPDLEVLASNDLGTGSPAVCDKSSGGIPGFDPPDLDSGAVVNALRDMACRFTVQTTSSDACTRNRLGNFAFLGGGTTKQYCFQVPQVAAFPRNRETVLRARLRDDQGTAGPTEEIVVRVLGP